MIKLELDYNEVRLLKAGLEARDRLNLQKINDVWNGKEPSQGNKAFEYARKEHKEILDMRSKLDNYLVDDSLDIAIDYGFITPNQVSQFKSAMAVKLDKEEINKMIQSVVKEEQEQEEQPRKTYILQAKDTLHKDHIDNAECELCKKLNANVVIIPAQYNYLGIDYGKQQGDTAVCNIVLDGVAISKALVDKTQLSYRVNV